MTWKGIEKPVSGRVIRTAWGVGVVEALDELYGWKAPFYGGYLVGDIIPDIDVAYCLGKPLARIKQVHAESVYASYFIIGSTPKWCLHANHKGLLLIDLIKNKRYRLLMRKE